MNLFMHGDLPDSRDSDAIFGRFGWSGGPGKVQGIRLD